MNATSPTIYFDGVCNLCNRSVQFIIKRDKRRKFRFASLQGKAGQAMLAHYSLPQNEINSFILVEDEKVYSRSTAALRTVKLMGGPWKLLYGLIILPRFIRDPVYNWIARNRYKWFGRMEACMIPSPSLRDRFLD